MYPISGTTRNNNNIIAYIHRTIGYGGGVAFVLPERSHFIYYIVVTVRPYTRLYEADIRADDVY